MRAHEAKSDRSPSTSSRAADTSPGPRLAQATTSRTGVIQRKCACGGSCPRCKDDEGFSVQARLEVGAPGTAFEREADRVADAVMRMPDGERARPWISALPSRETVSRSADDSEGSPRSPSPVASVVRSAGRPLERDTRAFFEPRLGRDLGRVRIHTGGAASDSARRLGARAYSVGNDIAFGAGEFEPETEPGRRLLAHELVHSIQAAGHDARIQRMCYGGEPGCVQSPPQSWINQYNARPVPADERVERVDDAIRQVREVAHDPETYARCHGVFEEDCPGGTATTFRDVFDAAALWKGDRPGANAFGRVNGSHIAYTSAGYGRGTRNLAETLVHELMHNCGLTGEDDHYLANVAGLYCIGPENELTYLIGGMPFSGSEYPIWMLTYRRLLLDLAEGDLQLRAGFDINLAGSIGEIVDYTTEDMPDAREWVAAMFGLRRRGLFGGERFGGITGSSEIGLAAGRFHVTEEPGEPEGTTVMGPGFVLQSGIGAEFYIPIGVSALPVSVEAAYRVVQPLNPRAEQIHAGLGKISFLW